MAGFFLKHPFEGLDEEGRRNRIEFDHAGTGMRENIGTEEAVGGEVIRPGRGGRCFSDDHYEGTDGRCMLLVRGLERAGERRVGCEVLLDAGAERPEGLGGTGEGIREFFD